MLINSSVAAECLQSDVQLLSNTAACWGWSSSFPLIYRKRTYQMYLLILNAFPGLCLLSLLVPPTLLQ